MRMHLLATLLFLLFAPTLSAHDSGVIEKVYVGGAAEAAGLRVGDRILRIGDLPPVTADDLQRIVGAHKPGDTVPVVIERDGETLSLKLSFGARPDGGVAIGLGVALEPGPGAEDPNSGASQCLAWIEETYRVEASLAELKLDRSEDLTTVRKCVERDARLMGTERAVRFCKNIFQVHCSAGDLLAEIGEAKIARCAEALALSLGPGLQKTKAWRTCVEPQLFEGYVRDGKLPDADACRTALLDGCTTNLDQAQAAGTLTAAQAAFVACCAGDADPADCSMLGSADGRACGAPDDVCLDRESAEWIRCSVLH